MYNQQSKSAIVLAADYAYIRQLETTLKSIIFHNAHLKIYIFNQDIPREWFSHYRRILRTIGSDLEDVKLNDIGLANRWTLHSNLFHINYMTFARYFIPQFVEEEVVLYLDTDIVVTKELDELFTLDISDYYLAASRAAFGHGIGFNAGVMLINNRRWKQENMTQTLIEVTDRDYTSVDEGDQTILNNLMRHNHLSLADTYNYQIGFDKGAHNYGHYYLFENSLTPLPAILHYVSSDKPWNTHSSGRLRDVWWHYALMDWSDILNKWSAIYQEVSLPQRKKALLVTHTYLIPHIEEIVSACPDWEFHIAAFTNMAGNLLNLEAHENVVLHPRVLGKVLETFITECDVYLDIDRGHKDSYFINLIQQADKPVLSFEDTMAEEFADYGKHLLFDSQTASELIGHLKASF